MARAPSKRPGGALRKAWPIYQIRDLFETTQMVQDPDTDQWWYRHTRVNQVGLTRHPGFTPWTLPRYPVAVGHTPGCRARRVPRTYALLPPLSDQARAAARAARVAAAKAYKRANRKAMRQASRENRGVGPTARLG